MSNPLSGSSYSFVNDINSPYLHIEDFDLPEGNDNQIVEATRKRKLSVTEFSNKKFKEEVKAQDFKDSKPLFEYEWLLVYPYLDITENYIFPNLISSKINYIFFKLFSSPFSNKELLFARPYAAKFYLELLSIRKMEDHKSNQLNALKWCGGNAITSLTIPRLCSKEHLSLIFTRFTALSSLNINGCNLVGGWSCIVPKDSLEGLKVLSNLKTLTIRNFDKLNISLAKQIPSGLSKICFQNIYSSWVELIKNQTNLTSLCSKNLINILDLVEGVKYLSKLTELDVKVGLKSKEATIYLIKVISNISSICLRTDHDNLDPIWLNEIPKNIHTLGLISLRSLHGMGSLPWINFLKKFPLLTSLNLKNSNIVHEDDVTREAICHLTMLTNLNLSLTNIPPISMLRLKTLTKLTILKVNHCHKIIDNSLSKLSTSLRELSIKDCEKLTGSGIMNIVKTFTGLEKLKIFESNFDEGTLGAYELEEVRQGFRVIESKNFCFETKFSSRIESDSYPKF